MTEESGAIRLASMYLTKSLVSVENRVRRVHGVWTCPLKLCSRFWSGKFAEIVEALGSDDLRGRYVVPNEGRRRSSWRYLCNLLHSFKLLYCLIEILQYFEPTLWKFAGTALSGGGGVVEAKVCLAVGGVVALDDVHIYFMVVQT